MCFLVYEISKGVLVFECIQYCFCSAIAVSGFIQSVCDWFAGETVMSKRHSRNAFQEVAAPFGEKQHILQISAYQNGAAAARGGFTCWLRNVKKSNIFCFLV